MAHASSPLAWLLCACSVDCKAAKASFFPCKAVHWLGCSVHSAFINVQHGVLHLLDELHLLPVGHVWHGKVHVLHRCPATCSSAVEQQWCFSKKCFNTKLAKKTNLDWNPPVCPSTGPLACIPKHIVVDLPATTHQVTFPSFIASVVECHGLDSVEKAAGAKMPAGNMATQCLESLLATQSMLKMFLVKCQIVRHVCRLSHQKQKIKGN